MKVLKWVVLICLSSIVFGYGWYLADDKFLKWMSVVVWSLSIVFVQGLKELE